MDPVGLVRRKNADQNCLLAQYVNDRPYGASSFMGVVIGQIFGSALQGRCQDRPELAATTGAVAAAVLSTAVVPIRAEPPKARERSAGELLVVPLSPTVKMELVWCPTGSFAMGSLELGHQSDEIRHRVTFTKGFYLGRSWSDRPAECRAAFRGKREASSRGARYGLRVCLGPD